MCDYQIETIFLTHQTHTLFFETYDHQKQNDYNDDDEKMSEAEKQDDLQQWDEQDLDALLRLEEEAKSLTTTTTATTTTTSYGDADDVIDGMLVRWSDQQRHAIDAALEGRNVFLTAGGGTGKSLVTRHMIRLLRRRGKTVVVTGSTGTAAVALGGCNFGAGAVKTEE